jgi:hypothetical protein
MGDERNIHAEHALEISRNIWEENIKMDFKEIQLCIIM